MLKTIKYLIFSIFIICFAGLERNISANEAISYDQKKINKKIAKILKALPVQDRGRIKPFDTFSREAVEFISGRSSIKDRDNVHIVMTWILLPHMWDNTPFVFVQKANVKEALDLNSQLNYFSPFDLSQNKNFLREVSELKIRKEKKEKLNDYLSEIEKLESQLFLYQAIRQGYLPLWLPSKEESNWQSARDLEGKEKQTFVQVLTQYSNSMSSHVDQDFLKAVKSFYQFIPASLGKRINMEVHYNSLHPFRWAWGLYLIGLILFFSLILWPKFQNKIPFIFFISAFIIHTYGIILRSYIMFRPPVSNMFETLLWVPWAAVVFSCILACIRKNLFPVIVGAVCAFFCLFLSDTASSILNGNLEPLEAVLRSNFWLSTHVLVITMSYSAFFLAFIMGDFLVFQFLLGKKEAQLKNHLWFLNRTLQIGVLLLALGTILGGIWADYSWGRFWGWDPKEVWALVSLLGYLALLHAKVHGWIEGFGLAMGSIYCFFLIIMAWYGVNFVLGQGLHSYGFGKGGLPYVLIFIGIHLLFMFVVWRWRKFSRLS